MKDSKVLIIIDTDTEFINRFTRRLQYNKLDKKISLISVVPNTVLSLENIIEDVLKKVGPIYDENHSNIVAFFVDIVVVEAGVKLDTSGIDIANKLRQIYPDVLVFNITSKVSFDRQLDVFSDAVLEGNDGVFSKHFLEGDSFNEARLDKILKVRETRNCLALGQSCTPASFDVGILTALYMDEFENIRPLFNFSNTIEDDTKFYHVGSLVSSKGNKISVIATHQNKTGIVDAAILSTEIVNRFKPKFLIMPGVCGGSGEDINFGDIVFASSVFLHQKGKETNSGFQNEIDNCEIDSKLLHKIREARRELLRLVQDSDPSRKNPDLDIHIKPMACGLTVIDKEGFFDGKIKGIDRNTIAVDMESFSVARACSLSNDKKTKAVIVKSIMDMTTGKNDHAKAYAGYTSAQFVFYLIRNILFD